MSSRPQVHAQSSDALIDKTRGQGILTTKEAQDLRDESDPGFHHGFQAKDRHAGLGVGLQVSTATSAAGMTKWPDTDGTRIFATRDAVALPHSRAGVSLSMKDNLEAGFSLTREMRHQPRRYSNGGGNPLSSKQHNAG